MRRLVLGLLIPPLLASCATHPQSASSVKRSIDAVVVSETARQKVVQAINSGATPDQAMAKVSDGPKGQMPIPQ